MRNRIAVWGRDAKQERVLLTLELKTEDNLVHILTYAEKVVTDEVYQNFMTKWRKNQETELPEPNQSIVRELSVTEGLLPDELKAEQTDMINLAQNEWHYAVLSDKLTKSYLGELSEIEDQVDRAGRYESNHWNQLKTFWEKVQAQLRDKTLLREHGNKLRTTTDGLFNKMKELRGQLENELKEKSKGLVEEFNNKLTDFEGRIEEGSHLRKVFDELRQLQSRFHNVKFTKSDRDAIYKRIDRTFKAVKAKRGQGGDGNASGDRTSKRMDGLLKAMERMESSIHRDEKDLAFQHKRITTTNEQMESQIRQAKIMMIQSRIDSKKEKLADMIKTKTMLEQRLVKEKQRAEKNKAREEQRLKEAAIKEKIAKEVAEQKSELSAEETAKLAAAAAAIKEGKQSRAKVTPEEAATAEENPEAIEEQAPVVEAATTAPEEAATAEESPEVVEEQALVEEAVTSAPETAEEVVAETSPPAVETPTAISDSPANTPPTNSLIDDIVAASEIIS